MSEIKKKVDESWKEQAEREKHTVPKPPAGKAVSPPVVEPSAPATADSGEPEEREEGYPQARFDLFVSSLAMEALIALGDMPHPATRKQQANLPHAKYLIDLIGILEEKTRGNVLAEEERLLKDTLYQLRMRYLAKSGG